MPRHVSRALALFALLVLSACGGGGSGNGGAAPGSTAAGAGSGSATLTAPPGSAGSNVIPVVLDGGPISDSGTLNTAYVSVTVCTPGTSGSTSACQAIDHVQLDTGSSGLRLIHSVLSATLNLPAATSGGQAIGECEQFADGFTWGSVRLADVYLGGEVATSVAIQDIGDSPGGAGGVPGDCAATGANEDTVATIGANGILGIGLFVNDCDVCTTAPVPAATYYTCTTGGCSGAAVGPAQIVRNPAALFQKDNNGVILDLPAIPAGGATGLMGRLIFGIGTRTNNALGSAVSYATDANGNFTTRYTPVGSVASIAMTGFIDSGSNGVFFPDPSIPACGPGNNAGFYCPQTTLSLFAINQSATGAASGTIGFAVDNLANLPASIVAAHVAGPLLGTGSGNQFDWGLPFFFGRPVFTAFSGAITPAGAGPYWAY